MTHVKGLFRRAMNHRYLLAVLFVLGMSGERSWGVNERAECHMWQEPTGALRLARKAAF